MKNANLKRDLIVQNTKDMQKNILGIINFNTKFYKLIRYNPSLRSYPLQMI